MLSWNPPKALIKLADLDFQGILPVFDYVHFSVPLCFDSTCVCFLSWSIRFIIHSVYGSFRSLYHSGYSPLWTWRTRPALSLDARKYFLKVKLGSSFQCFNAIKYFTRYGTAKRKVKRKTHVMNFQENTHTLNRGERYLCGYNFLTL